jgi:hypothetical protein
MTTSSGPSKAPANSAEPGLSMPILALLMVFVIGMVCVGLIYAVGDPIETPDAKAQMQSVETKQAETSSTEQAQPTRPATAVQPSQAYVSPGGTSPMPKHGEAEAKPIPAPILIDDEAFNAEPPQASTLPEPDGAVPWDEADKYLERVITVKGTIVDANNIGNICFLNYDTDWQGKFYIAMFKEAFELLPDPPETHYLDKTLLVTGKVTLHRDRPQIEVHDVSQIEVVE